MRPSLSVMRIVEQGIDVRFAHDLEIQSREAMATVLAELELPADEILGTAHSDAIKARLREQCPSLRGAGDAMMSAPSPPSRCTHERKDFAMPLLHIAMRAGKPDSYRQAIFDSLYQAMREALDVPEDDQFMTLSEHEAANFRYGAAFGVARSDDLVYIRITVFDTRTAEQKKALFRRIAERLGESPGIRPEDVFITIAVSAKENWSVGNGIAQFA